MIPAQLNDSKLLSRSQCPCCAGKGRDNSQDNLATYDDGHQYCFSCGYYKKDKKSMIHTVSDTAVQKSFDAYHGNAIALPHRRVMEKSCRKYRYQSLESNSKNLEIENYYNFDGTLKAQKVRDVATKNFHWVGDTKNLPMFGQHLFENNGKRILITEGAIDTLTMSQLFDDKYPVVSLPGGVQSAEKSVRENYEFIASFETIVLCFDMDDPGQKASREVAELLPPGKVKIMSMPRKDPNEMLMNGEGKDLIGCYWNAKTHSPDSILHVSDILDSKSIPSELYEYPWDKLTDFMIGQDGGRLTLWTSATGHGKSSIVREILWHHLSNDNATGCVFLEESPESTVDDLISLKLGKPVRKIIGQRQLNELRDKFDKPRVDIGIEDNLTDEEYKQAREEIKDLPLYIYDHIGNSNISNIMARLEFMAVGLGCKVLIVDHITLLGNILLSDDQWGSERLILDDTMKQLRALVERTGVIVHVISHIKKTDKNVDEGERINLSDLRGSGSLAQIADYVIALERNRHHADDRISNTTNIRVLKNRKTGKCGIACALFYDHKTSRLDSVDFTVTPEGEVLYNYEGVSI